MAHTLGFGVVWDMDEFKMLDPMDCRTKAAQGKTFSASFKGAFTSIANTAAKPGLASLVVSRAEVESVGSASCGHWSERFFGTELMTGFIAPGSNPLSRVTVASLQDMGYTVNNLSPFVDQTYKKPAVSGRADAITPEGRIRLSGCLDRLGKKPPISMA